MSVIRCEMNDPLPFRVSGMRCGWWRRCGMGALAVVVVVITGIVLGSHPNSDTRYAGGYQATPRQEELVDGGIISMETMDPRATSSPQLLQYWRRLRAAELSHEETEVKVLRTT